MRLLFFDELVNFDFFNGPNSELKALNEFILEKNLKYKWLGMKGKVDLSFTVNVPGYYYHMGHSVALQLI
jgi:hypothetical protein